MLPWLHHRAPGSLLRRKPSPKRAIAAWKSQLSALGNNPATLRDAAIAPVRAVVTGDPLQGRQLGRSFGTPINHRLKPLLVRSTLNSCRADAIERHSA
jgi:hypothetical protein